MILEASKLAMLKVAAWQSLYTVSISALLTALLGIPLGVLLVVFRPGHILANRPAQAVLGVAVNALRSIPFPIFIVFVIPLTRLLVGTSLGPKGVVVPLTLAATVFMARLTETALLEVPKGVIEAAQACGAGRWEIVWRVLLPEARPGLILAVTIMVVTLVSYSAMAGAVGGGGLGDLAIRYGYQRYQTDVMLITVLLLLIAVQLTQNLGDWLARRFSRR